MSDLETQLTTMENTINPKVIKANESSENTIGASLINQDIKQDDCNNLTNDLTMMNTRITDAKEIKDTLINILGKKPNTQDDINLKSSEKAQTNTNTNILNNTINPIDNCVKNTLEDDTIISTQDDTNLIPKSNIFIDDYNNQRFTTDFFPDKRSGKMRNLKEEFFDFDIYQNNQCGFQTCRPFDWIQALENYVTNKEGIKCHWDYKENPEGKYETCELVIYSKNIKQVKVLVYIKTGILMVKGQQYKEFIINEFSEIAKEILSLPLMINPLYRQPDNVEPICPTNIAEEEKKELESGLSLAWEDIEANKKAINIIEKNIESLIKSSQNTINEQRERDKNIKEERLNLEKRYDEKLVIFMATYKEQYENTLTNMKIEFDKKIYTMQDRIGKFEIIVEEQLNKFTKQITEWNKTYDNWVQEQVLEYDNPLKETIGEIEKSLEFHAKEVYDLREECKEALRKQNKLTENIYNNQRVKEVNRQPENAAIIQTLTQTKEPHKRPSFTETELLICMDSNRRFIDYRKLWTLKGSQRWACGNLFELREKVEKEEKIKNVKYMLINVGVNDLDQKSGENVFDELKNTINIIRNKYEGIKIMLSEITPRRDEKDAEVKICNDLITDWANTQQYIYLARHNNLRDPEWTMFFDTKHIHRLAVPRFAANLKRVLREAYGITNTYNKSNRINNRQGNTQFDNRYNWSDRNQNLEFLNWK